MTQLTVLIPNYNGKELLARLLPTVFQSLSYAAISYEIIIVDDYSKDDSINYLENEFPAITVLKNDKNKGFALTCNRGIQHAKGKYILLLNTDIELSTEYIKKCLSNFQSENTFAVMGKALDNSATPQTTGVLFKQKAFSVEKYPNLMDNETHFVSGANSMYDTQKLKELKGFNPIFSPYYFEDDDLSYRAMLKGWKSYFVEDAICQHIGASTIKSCAQKTKIKRIYFRNKMIFNHLHCNTSKRIFTINNLIINVLPKYCIGNFWIWKSYNEYLNLNKKHYA